MFFPSWAWGLYESRSLLLSVQTTNNRKQQMVGLGLYNSIWFWKLLVHWLYWKTVWTLVILGIWMALLNPFTTERNMIPDSCLFQQPPTFNDGNPYFMGILYRNPYGMRVDEFIPYGNNGDFFRPDRRSHICFYLPTLRSSGSCW